jgi:diguanylate cyclase (GGDEF)-like protein
LRVLNAAASGRPLLACLALILAAFALLPSPAAAATHRLPFRAMDCQAEACPVSPPGRWTWFAIDVRDARDLEPDWQLLVDNTRFSNINVRVQHSGGTLLIQRDQFNLDENWSLGNNLRFAIPLPGKSITAIWIGFKDIDAPGMVRTIKAMDKMDHALFVQDWTVLIAIVMGVLFAAFTYNVFLLSWLHIPFQRWYVVWVAAALAYLLIWSGKILQFFPFLAGPASARTSFLLVGLLVVSGASFFFALIEKGKLPQRLIDIGQVAGILVAVTSVVASFDTVFAAAYTDRMFNLAMIIVTALLAVGCVHAMLRRSRAVWFYLIGWLPALVLLGARILRNFGVLPQDDVIDQAGFAAMAWEALVLSLAIADRFRQLRQEADATDKERRILLKAATTDPLTGLGNRALFQNLLERPHGNGNGVDIVAVDIDFLKQTNDMAGHDAGDALIIAVSERLAAAAGPNAIIARIGGDEFVILLEGDARARLPALRQMIALSAGVPLRHAGYDLTISICAGHASDDGSSSLQAVYKLADMALYRAKAAGRGCWRSFDANMADEAVARSRMVSEARSGLPAGQFLLQYQPIAAAGSQIIAYEALLRWQHPELGLLVPDQFGEVMRESSLALQLNQWVLEQAVMQAVALRRDRPDVAVAVNCITSQLQGPSAAIAILDELARHSLPPTALIIEITEAVATGGLGSALFECLECLRDSGVRVALDDFGTGNASLLSLRDVPSDLIKIDASFISSLTASTGSQQVVRAIIDLAHSLGKKVLAQGVNGDPQRRVLVEMGCDYGQGDVFGLPLAIPTAKAAAA